MGDLLLKAWEKRKTIDPNLLPIVDKCCYSLELTQEEFDLIIEALDFDIENVLYVKLNRIPNGDRDIVSGCIDEDGEPLLDVRIYKPRNTKLAEFFIDKWIVFNGAVYVWVREYGGFASQRELYDSLTMMNTRWQLTLTYKNTMPDLFECKYNRYGLEDYIMDTFKNIKHYVSAD